ncbi:hypothetical protein SEPCBS119000_006641 [Sporothrix epigloea]|uniref:NADH dehydrogenase [ubiquinone] 1 alpha subcomplex subunit n=1 Tax=Sporothrix epigloea TaxID=1892477 RepID=A0ABP0E7A4_9PEZI
MGSRVSPFWNTWYQWKALRLPWRKHFLAGRDLNGNTYWEFNDLRHSQSAIMAEARPGDGIRMRRIVKYPRGTHPGAVMVSPQWHQWLRHVREDAPTVEEQQREVARQAQMRVLAARADARWAGAKRVDGPVEAVPAAARPSVAEPIVVAAAAAEKEAHSHTHPETQTTSQRPPLEPEPVYVRAQQQQPPPREHRQPQQQQTVVPEKEKDPWKQEELAQGHGALGEAWQPGQWRPSAAER